MTRGLGAGGVELMNEVVLNQVVASFGDDARIEAMIAAVRDSLLNREKTGNFGVFGQYGEIFGRISSSNQ